MRKSYRRKCTVLDAGATLGASISLPALSVGCKVLAFELQEELREMIKTSAKLNDFEEDELVINGPIATELIHSQMVLNLLENSKMVKQTDKELLHTQMVINLLQNTKMVSLTDRELLHMQMEINLLENTKMVS